MFQIIPRQVLARRMVPLTVRGISVAPRLTPIHCQTSLRFYSDKKGPEKSHQEAAQDPAEPKPKPKPNHEEETLSLRQKLYQTNTWHEAEQLRKQLRQHGEEVPEPSPTAPPATNNVDTEQQQPLPQVEEQPPLEEEPQTPSPEPPLQEDPLQSARESILQIRTLITDLDDRSHYFGEYEPNPKATLANAELSKIESILENIVHNDQQLGFDQGEMTANEAKIFRWLQRVEKEKAGLVADLVNTQGGLKEMERRLSELKKRPWSWAWMLIVAGGTGAGVWVLPEEKKGEYIEVLKREWESLRKWVEGRLEGMKKMTAVTKGMDEGEVVVKEKIRPEGEVVVYSYPKLVGQLDGQQQRLSRLSQFFLVLFWFLCWARGFPKVSLPGRVARN